MDIVGHQVTDHGEAIPNYRQRPQLTGAPTQVLMRLGPDNTVVIVNPGVERSTTGVDAGATEDRTRHLHPDDHHRMERALLTVMAGHNHVGVQGRLLRDGCWTWCYARVMLVGPGLFSVTSWAMAESPVHVSR